MTDTATKLSETAMGPIYDWCFQIKQSACCDLCRNVATGKNWWEDQDPRFAAHNLLECLTRGVLAVDPARGYVLTTAGRAFLESGALPPLPGPAENYHVAFNTNVWTYQPRSNDGH